ncbi:MAG: hypothetical protein VKN13_02825 [Cyanobacteriota bacterium]|nr:hypothetical protein [Cyanobacteriota bacterium]
MKSLTSPTRTSTSIGTLPAMRRPQRICITVSFATYQSLQERSLREGRSLSNLAAFLLEKQLHLPAEGSPTQVLQGQPPR